jgi:pimeloyl-ACP methyl ester carboxylesterase
VTQRCEAADHAARSRHVPISAAARESDTRSRAVSLAYECSGDGIPVVFLHGLTFDRRAWRPIVDRLGGHVLSIAFDLPGHGQSTGSGLAFERLAALIRARLDELGVERPVVVGHSMSGGLAMAYAAGHPVRGA